VCGGGGVIYGSSILETSTDTFETGSNWGNYSHHAAKSKGGEGIEVPVLPRTNKKETGRKFVGGGANYVAEHVGCFEGVARPWTGRIEYSLVGCCYWRWKRLR
jgi:hypothetical protein